MVDYSRWDNLEVDDSSDEEPPPACVAASRLAAAEAWQRAELAAEAAGAGPSSRAADPHAMPDLPASSEQGPSDDATLQSERQRGAATVHIVGPAEHVNHSWIKGAYDRTEQTVDGRPVYSLRTDGDVKVMLWHHEGLWRIGPDACLGTCACAVSERGAHGALLPERVKAWQVRETPQSETFYAAPKLRCIDDTSLKAELKHGAATVHFAHESNPEHVGFVFDREADLDERCRPVYTMRQNRDIMMWHYGGVWRTGPRDCVGSTDCAWAEPADLADMSLLPGEAQHWMHYNPVRGQFEAAPGWCCLDHVESLAEVLEVSARMVASRRAAESRTGHLADAEARVGQLPLPVVRAKAPIAAAAPTTSAAAAASKGDDSKAKPQLLSKAAAPPKVAETARSSSSSARAGTIDYSRFEAISLESDEAPTPELQPGLGPKPAPAPDPRASADPEPAVRGATCTAPRRLILYGLLPECVRFGDWKRGLGQYRYARSRGWIRPPHACSLA